MAESGGGKQESQKERKAREESNVSKMTVTVGAVALGLSSAFTIAAAKGTPLQITTEPSQANPSTTVRQVEEVDEVVVVERHVNGGYAQRGAVPAASSVGGQSVRAGVAAVRGAAPAPAGQPPAAAPALNPPPAAASGGSHPVP